MEISSAEFMEQISSIIGKKFDKFEIDIKEAIEKLDTKITDLSIRHSETSERLSSVEGMARACDSAKTDQGRRIGQLEQAFAVFEAKTRTEAETRERMNDKAAGWVKWIPGLLFGFMGVAGTIFGIVMAASKV